MKHTFKLTAIAALIALTTACSSNKSNTEEAPKQVSSQQTDAEKVAADKAAAEKAAADKAAADKAAVDKAAADKAAADKAAADKAAADKAAADKAAADKAAAEKAAAAKAAADKVEKKRSETQAYRESLETFDGKKWRVSYSDSSPYDIYAKVYSLQTSRSGGSTDFNNIENQRNSVQADFSQYEINPNKVQNYAFSAKELEGSQLKKVAFVNLRNATYYSTSSANPENNKLVGIYLKESEKLLTPNYRTQSEYLSTKPTATYKGKALGENAQTWGDIELTADFNKDTVSGKLSKADKTATYTLDEGSIFPYKDRTVTAFEGRVITDPVSYKANDAYQGKYSGTFLGKDAIEMIGKADIIEYDKYGKAKDKEYILFGGSREPASNFPIAGEKTNYK